MNHKKKVTAFSVKEDVALFERDYQGANCAIYNSITPSSKKRLYEAVDRLPWNKSRVVVLPDYLIVENAELG